MFVPHRHSPTSLFSAHPAIPTAHPLLITSRSPPTTHCITPRNTPTSRPSTALPIPTTQRARLTMQPTPTNLKDIDELLRIP